MYCIMTRFAWHAGCFQAGLCQLHPDISLYWLQYLETLDQMETIEKTSSQQTLTDSSSLDEPNPSSNGSTHSFEAGEASPTSSSAQVQSSLAAKASSNGSSASKVLPLGYRSAHSVSGNELP